MHLNNPATGKTSLNFLHIWHKVFVSGLDYAITGEKSVAHIDRERVGDPDICMMGHWLAEQPSTVKVLDVYARLDDDHRRFHSLAGEVAGLQSAGQFAEARTLFDGEFNRVSDAVLAGQEALARQLGLALVADSGQQVQRIWDVSYEVGIPEVDRRHHTIAVLIEQVLLSGNLKCAGEDAALFLDVLGKMIEQEIVEESELLEQMENQSTAVTEHLEAHDGILAYLKSLRQLASAGEDLEMASVGRYLASWYIEHLVTYDLELERKFRQVPKPA